MKIKEKVLELYEESIDYTEYPDEEIEKVIDLTIAEVIKLIDEDMDIELMFTDIKDKQGNKIPESDELMELFGLFWIYVRDRIKNNLEEKNERQI